MVVWCEKMFYGLSVEYLSVRHWNQLFFVSLIPWGLIPFAKFTDTNVEWDHYFLPFHDSAPEIISDLQIICMINWQSREI